MIAGSNGTGANAKIVTYDEYGRRGSGGSYRFAFTGQVHLINDIYDYKARNYNARLGRFVQTDPIGYGDGMNMYAYVGGDPVNFTDPMGTQETDAYASNQPYWIDNDDEWGPGKGLSVAETAGGHVRDRMGTMDFVRIAGGRSEAADFERNQAAAFYAAGGRWSDPIRDAKDKADAVFGEIVDAISGLGTGTAHAPKPGPSDTDLRKIPDRDANTVAQHHGYDDAHDAKLGRGGSRVNIYYDRSGGRFYLWDGHSPEKEPL